uniref:SLP adaptor and CSK interacting membrane protein n=1 Tax=Vombatus ursinus TaxID=29139 RepID=A0A4X2JTW0_VOMUR
MKAGNLESVSANLPCLAKLGCITMNWWLENFWILLAGTIILVSVTLALVMYCICRRLLRQGKKWKISKSVKRTQKDEETIYENVTNEPPVCSPPLPPRNQADNTASRSQVFNLIRQSPKQQRWRILMDVKRINGVALIFL